MPSTSTYQARVFSMSAVCSRKCSMWLRGMCGTLSGLFQADQLHETGKLGILFRDQLAEFVGRKEGRAHRELFARLDEIRALDRPADGMLEDRDGTDRRAFRNGDPAPGLERHVDTLLLRGGHIRQC